MDLTYGMDCPGCGKHNSFMGGHFGGGVNSTNYNCDCGFSAVLLINYNHQWDHFEVKGIPAENKSN